MIINYTFTLWRITTVNSDNLSNHFKRKSNTIIMFCYSKNINVNKYLLSISGHKTKRSSFLLRLVKQNNIEAFSARNRINRQIMGKNDWQFFDQSEQSFFDHDSIKSGRRRRSKAVENDVENRTVVDWNKIYILIILTSILLSFIFF